MMQKPDVPPGDGIGSMVAGGGQGWARHLFKVTELDGGRANTHSQCDQLQFLMLLTPLLRDFIFACVQAS